MRSYPIPSRGAVQHGVGGANLITSDPLHVHFALDKLLVDQEVRAVAGSFSDDRYDLTLVQPRYSMRRPDLFNSVKGPIVCGVCRRLCLQT